MSEEIRVTIEDDADDGSPNAGRSSRRTIEEMEREAAEARAETVRLKAETARLRLTSARLRIGAGVETANSEARAAEVDNRHALEAGDFEGATAAQRRMAEIEARRVRLLEHDQVLQNMPAVPADPVEAACAGRTEPTAAWLRKHPDWVTDPRKNAKLSAAHFDAEADGLVADTPEYFARIEKQIGISGNGRDQSSARGGVIRNGGARPAEFNPADPKTHVWDGGREVFLTKGEREAATKTLLWNYGPKKGQPLGLEEYAKRKAAMIAAGRYNVVE